jgi:hypothetical protein
MVVIKIIGKITQQEYVNSLTKIVNKLSKISVQNALATIS